MKLGAGIQYFDTHHSSELIDDSQVNRPISLYCFSQVTVSGWDLSYPNILLSETGNDTWYLPVKEAFMSLGRDSNYESFSDWCPSHPITPSQRCIRTRPVFFFGYNLSNFYHFMYDTLPYLNGYLFLKSRGINPLVLVGQSANNHLPQFVKEILSAIGINVEDDIVYASADLIIDQLYVINSYTHDGKSLDPPHPSCKYPLEFAIKRIRSAVAGFHPIDPTPSRIYISRRTSSSSDFSNIGTNYTERRRFCNEDSIVSSLVNLGFTEVFAESLTLAQKIDYFKNAEIVVAPAGGGLANLILAPNSLSVILINSPLFWETNKRLRFAFNHLTTYDYNDTAFAAFTQPMTSGKDQLSAEGGLNSPWLCDTSSFIQYVRALLNHLA